MVTTTLTIVALLGICIRTWKPLRNSFDDTAGLVLIFAMWVCIIMVALIPFFMLLPLEGIDSTYSEGERIGYVTKLSQKGFFWKTFEGEMQSGAGEQAALQGTYVFSVKDPQILDKVKKSMGKSVILKYREWLCMPYRVGSSGYEITNVELR